MPEKKILIIADLGEPFYQIVKQQSYVAGGTSGIENIPYVK